MRCGILRPPRADATDEHLRERIKELTSLLSEASEYLWAYAILNKNDETLALCKKYDDNLWNYGREEEK